MTHFQLSDFVNGNRLHKFCKEMFANYLQTTRQRKFAHFTGTGSWRVFQKCIFYHFLDNFFLQTFLLCNWILQKKNQFWQICKFFFANSKSRVQELSNDVSFVIFGHQTWDLEGGGSNTPPPCVSWFSSTPAGIGLKSLSDQVLH